MSTAIQTDALTHEQAEVVRAARRAATLLLKGRDLCAQEEVVVVLDEDKQVQALTSFQALDSPQLQGHLRYLEGERRASNKRGSDWRHCNGLFRCDWHWALCEALRALGASGDVEVGGTLRAGPGSVKEWERVVEVLNGIDYSSFSFTG